MCKQYKRYFICIFLLGFLYQGIFSNIKKMFCATDSRNQLAQQTRQLHVAQALKPRSVTTSNL